VAKRQPDSEAFLRFRDGGVVVALSEPAKHMWFVEPDGNVRFGGQARVNAIGGEDAFDGLTRPQLASVAALGRSHLWWRGERRSVVELAKAHDGTR
jgi:hypothetical protein